MLRLHHAQPTNHCQNCGTTTQGRYCHVCGQESIVQTLSLRPMFAELINELFGYDSKLLRTLRPLLIRPGFLTNEYISGKRVAYLPPFRLYFFLSVLFFLVLSMRQNPAETVHLGLKDTNSKTPIQVQKRDSRSKSKPVTQIATKGNPQLKDIIPKDVVWKVAAAEDAAQKIAAHQSLPKTKAKPTPNTQNVSDDAITINGFRMEPSELPDTVAEYDRQQRDPNNRHKHPDWVRFFARKIVRSKELGESGFGQRLFDNLPRAMFLLLPLFALLLKLIYIRSRRLYIEHLIFALHGHAFVFLLLLVATLVARDWFFGVCLLWMVVYFYLAMRVVYRQSYLKTLVKYCILGFSYLMLLAFSLVGAALLTFLTV